MRTVGIFVLIFSIVANSVNLYGQEKKSRKQRKAERVAQTEKNLEQHIEKQNYIYYQRGGEYLIVTKNRIETTFLPQYSKDNNLVTHAAIAFYDEFEYKVEKSEKGGWDIYIKIELDKAGRWVEMFLNVRPDGSANLEGRIYTIDEVKYHSIKAWGYIQGPKRNGKF